MTEVDWTPRELFRMDLDGGFFITGEIWPDQMGFVNVRDPSGHVFRGSGFRGEDQAGELLMRYIAEMENDHNRSGVLPA
jgi:hypothetical protein